MKKIKNIPWGLLFPILVCWYFGVRFSPTLGWKVFFLISAFPVVMIANKIVFSVIYLLKRAGIIEVFDLHDEGDDKDDDFFDKY